MKQFTVTGRQLSVVWHSAARYSTPHAVHVFQIQDGELMNAQDQPGLDPGRLEALHWLLLSVHEQQARVGAELSAMLAALADADGTEANSPGSLGMAGQAAQLSEAGTVRAQVPLPLSKGPTFVRCLGALEVQVGGVAIATWRSGKARALFEYLVTHRRLPVPRDTLIQALWPDPEALASGTSLKVAVHALRQMFSTAAPGGPQPQLGVVVQESSYQIQARDLWLDVEEFERCCALGGRLEVRGQLQEAQAAYQRAVDLYRGDFLPESWNEWAIFRREGLKDQFLGVLAKLADARLHAGEYHACIALCRQLLEQDCCREDTFRMLMVCHAYLGQRGRVRRWFELCEMTLRSGLDTVPEPETVRVFKWACGTGTNGAVHDTPWTVPPSRLTAL